MPFPAEATPWLFYRLGPTKEKELFKRHRGTYDGVVIPAHIATYFHKFCSEFVGALGKPYFIDPMTYIFTNDPAHLRRYVKDKKGRTKRDPASGRKRKGEIKRSYSKLVKEEYKGVIESAVKAGRRLVPEDLASAEARSTLVQNVVNFQTTRLAAIPEKYRKYQAYAERAGRPLSTKDNHPMCVVPPYFPTTTIQPHGWHSTNLLLVRESKGVAGELPVFPVLLVSSQVLAEDAERIARDYADAGADGILLWPDGFSGEQSRESVAVVFDAVEALSAHDGPVILMYGGAVSLALHYAGLAGFACGICYGERKRSTDDPDVEGAIQPRYYIERLKKKVIIETEVRRIQLDTFPDLGCECAVCQREPDPASLDDEESREHFMITRAAELAAIRNGLPKEGFAAALEDSYSTHKDDPLLQPIAHLENWAALLRRE